MKLIIIGIFVMLVILIVLYTHSHNRGVDKRIDEEVNRLRSLSDNEIVTEFIASEGSGQRFRLLCHDMAMRFSEKILGKETISDARD